MKNEGGYLLYLLSMGTNVNDTYSIHIRQEPIKSSTITSPRNSEILLNSIFRCAQGVLAAISFDSTFTETSIGIIPRIKFSNKIIILCLPSYV